MIRSLEKLGWSNVKGRLRCPACEAKRLEKTRAEVYAKAGSITPRQHAAAVTLRMAADGMPDRDPLAAIGEVRIRQSAGDAAAAHIFTARMAKG